MKIILISCNMNNNEIKEIKNDFFNNDKTEQVLIIYTLMAVAVGFDIDVFGHSNLIINFEENFTEIGIIAMGQVICCKTIPGAAEMNETVIAAIKDILENTPSSFTEKIFSEGVYLAGKALPGGIEDVIKKTGLKVLSADTDAALTGSNLILENPGKFIKLIL